MESTDDLPRRERRFLLALVAAFAFLAFLVFRPYAGWVLLALFLGYAAFPARDWLVARRVPRLAAAGLLTVVVTALVIAPFAFIAWQLSDELGNLAGMIESRGHELLLRRGFDRANLPPELGESAAGAIRDVLTGLAAASVAIVSEVAIGGVLAVFLLFSVIADGDKLVRWARDVAPLSDGRTEALARETRRAVDAVLFGVLAVSVVQGATAGLGWWLFGLPEPLFWGFVLVIASIVPYVGAHAVLIPAGLWLIATGDVPRGIGVVLFSMFVVGLVDNVVRPLLIGRRGGVHPGLVLVGVVGGVPAFGGIGILLGPIVLAIFVAVIEVWRRPLTAERDGQRHIEREAVENATRSLDEAEAAERAPHD